MHRPARALKVLAGVVVGGLLLAAPLVTDAHTAVSDQLVRHAIKTRVP